MGKTKNSYIMQMVKELGEDISQLPLQIRDKWKKSSNSQLC